MNIPTIHEEEETIQPWKTTEEYETMVYFSSQEYCSNYERLFKTGFVRNKQVLILRCGFGKVALLAKQYGASAVVAIDDRPVADFFKQVIKKMHYDNVIVERTTVDYVQDNFDVIICDWVGVNIIYDSSMREVIKAARLLNEGGMIVPNEASCYICGIGGMNYVEEKYHFWQNIYGYDMSSIVKNVVCTAYIDVIPSNCVVTDSCKLYSFNSSSFVPTERVETTFTITMTKKSKVDGFCTYFDADFVKHTFSTSPGVSSIWKQCCYFLLIPIDVFDIGDVITGKFKMEKRKKDNRWAVTIKYKCDKKNQNGQFEYEF